MPIAIPSALIGFLKNSKDLSLGYSEITFFNSNKVQEGQAGYGVEGGNDWNTAWTVIASDQMGDPIFVDTSIETLPVFTAMHGEGAWNPTKIADSLYNFKVIIEKLQTISAGRESPVDLENNPIPQRDADLLIQEIEMANPESESWYWEGFLEN